MPAIDAIMTGSPSVDSDDSSDRSPEFEVDSNSESDYHSRFINFEGNFDGGGDLDCDPAQRYKNTVANAV